MDWKILKMYGKEQVSQIHNSRKEKNQQEELFPNDLKQIMKTRKLRIFLLEKHPRILLKIRKDFLEGKKPLIKDLLKN